MIRFVVKHFLTLVVVALIHLVALTPGSFQRDVPALSRQAPTPPCTMIFPDGPWANPEILAWSELADPTLFARPNVEHGFAASLRHSLPPTYTPTPQRDVPVVIPAPRYLAAPERAIRLPQTPPDKVLTAMASRQRDEPQTPTRLPHTIVWLWRDGTPVDTPPSIDRQTLAGTIGDTQPTDETWIEILLADGRPRTRLARSCGVAALDQLAMETIGASLAGATADGTERLRLFGKSLPANGERVRIEWRLVTQNLEPR